MKRLPEDKLWMLVGAGAAVAATVATRAAMRAGWRYRHGDAPPLNPADPQVSWTQAAAWTAASGMVGALAGMVARRAAAEGWIRWKGRTPPGINDTEGAI